MDSTGLTWEFTTPKGKTINFSIPHCKKGRRNVGSGGRVYHHPSNPGKAFIPDFILKKVIGNHTDPLWVRPYKPGNFLLRVDPGEADLGLTLIKAPFGMKFGGKNQIDLYNDLETDPFFLLAVLAGVAYIFYYHGVPPVI